MKWSINLYILLIILIIYSKTEETNNTKDFFKSIGEFSKDDVFEVI